MSTRDDSTLMWFKSSYSSSGDGNSCVEIALTPRTTHVRDSKYREAGPRLALGADAWADFVAYACGS
ncbi:DUF397 domain-containing protein [Streptomyces parvulus]|uniref:DUF397 domain-containing protein n=1 Tax=Streptomyces parvulus TaxID=146923 RepID=A0A191V0I7_9ACTN|nr:DUF397 domain-containing protein [Streptomyces parvulus]ANJ08521.1 DUF397 domain-containing protein [Streptomyces parvulus]GGR56491.1 hypothetical protein GCM10010220_03220 [Streptomyces parvulus]